LPPVWHEYYFNTDTNHHSTQKMKKVLILFAAVCLSTVAVNAQGKLGHINGQLLLEHMPQYQLAYDTLKLLQADYENTLRGMEAEVQKKYQEYQSMEKQNSPKVLLESKAQEVTNLQQGMEDLRQSASEDISEQQVKRFQPILDKAKAAIADVAKANGYTYVFDSGEGTPLLYMGGDDLTKLVCAKLGIPDFTNEKTEIRLDQAPPGQGPVPPKK
jgi:outer membrane protein